MRSADKTRSMSNLHKSPKEEIGKERFLSIDKVFLGKLGSFLVVDFLFGSLRLVDWG